MQAPNELPLSAELCSNLVSVAENTADQVLLQECRPLQLEEEVDLQLPFLLPEDGHSCDIIRGLPAGLLDFLEGLQNAGLCWLWQNTQGPGSWKKFMGRDLQMSGSLLSNSAAVATPTAKAPTPVCSQQQQQQQQQQMIPDTVTLPVKQQQPRDGKALFDNDLIDRCLNDFCS